MVVDGVEVLRMIRDGEIKDKTKIKDDCKTYVYDSKVGSFFEDDANDDGNHIMHYFTDIEFSRTKFEILSEDKEINIQAIEEIEKIDFNGIDGRANLDIKSAREIGQKINALVKAVKQLDKKIK